MERREIMKIEKISPDQYEEFIKKNDLGYLFLQMPSYASLYNRFILAGLDDSNSISHAIIIEPRSAMRFWKYAYSASGYLSADRTKDHVFLRSVSQWLKQNGFILWRIESSIEIKEYDKTGAEVDDGFNNHSHLETMQEEGFIWHEIPRGIHTEYQNTWESVVELKPNVIHDRQGYIGKLQKNKTNYDFEYLLTTMGGSSRKYMRKAERDGFSLIVKKPSEMSEQDWKIVEEMIEKSGDFQGFDASDGGKRRELAETSENNCYLVMLLNKEGNVVYGGYWYYTNMEMLCYLGGMNRGAAKYNLASFIHTNMYKRALEMGLEQYNYGGISGYFDKTGEGYGCYQFKRELGAKVIRSFGVFDQPLSATGRLFEKKISQE